MINYFVSLLPRAENKIFGKKERLFNISRSCVIRMLYSHRFIVDTSLPFRNSDIVHTSSITSARSSCIQNQECINLLTFMSNLVQINI